MLAFNYKLIYIISISLSVVGIFLNVLLYVEYFSNNHRLVHPIYALHYIFIISLISSFSLAVRDPLRSTMQNHVNPIKTVSLLDRGKGVALVEKRLTCEGGTTRFLTKQLGIIQQSLTDPSVLP